MKECPDKLLQYLPKGHSLFFAPKRGAMRTDYLMCVCGLGIQLSKVPGPIVDGKPTVETEEITDYHWLDAVNQCRVATHNPPRNPRNPVTMEGIELKLRDKPPEEKKEQSETKTIHMEPETKKKVGRPKKEKVTDGA